LDATPKKASAELTDLKQENDLLLQQLHQVQEELEHYFLRNQELLKNQQSTSNTFVTNFWRMHQPSTLVINMQQDIVGENWYPAESDGRWAGPGKVSTIQLPPLQAGEYLLELDVIDTMNPGIIESMTLEVLDQPQPFEIIYPLYRGELPLICQAKISLPAENATKPWKICMRFATLVSPAETGSDDKRQLALRLRSLRLEKLS